MSPVTVKQKSPISDFLQDFAKNMLVVVIAMVAFWMVEARHYVTREEAYRIAEQSQRDNPYLKDREILMRAVQDISQTREQLTELVKQSTEATNALKVEIAILNARLEALKKEPK